MNIYKAGKQGAIVQVYPNRPCCDKFLSIVPAAHKCNPAILNGQGLCSPLTILHRQDRTIKIDRITPLSIGEKAER